jgi:hypothetical protein
MNYTTYTLEHPIVYTKTALRFSINVTNIELNKMAYIQVCLHDERDGVVNTVFYTLENEEYELWLDDQYLIEWVRAKLG